MWRGEREVRGEGGVRGGTMGSARGERCGEVKIPYVWEEVMILGRDAW